MVFILIFLASWRKAHHLGQNIFHTASSFKELTRGESFKKLPLIRKQKASFEETIFAECMFPVVQLAIAISKK